MSNKKEKQTFLGIKQLAKEFAITIPKARKALMAQKVMSLDGKPLKPEFAKESTLDDGSTWFRWDKDVVSKAFLKYGIKVPDAFEKFCHVQSKYQAQQRIYEAFQEIGIIAKLDVKKDSISETHAKAVLIYSQAVYSDMHVLGGPFELIFMENQSDCNGFLIKIEETMSFYVPYCLSQCESEKDIELIHSYEKALKAISKWVEKQFFRVS